MVCWQIRIMGCVFLMLVLCGRSETRVLNRTMVSAHMLRIGTSNLNWNSIQPISEEVGKRDEQRLSPGGPDAHHH